MSSLTDISDLRANLKLFVCIKLTKFIMDYCRHQVQLSKCVVAVTEKYNDNKINSFNFKFNIRFINITYRVKYLLQTLTFKRIYHHLLMDFTIKRLYISETYFDIHF